MVQPDELRLQVDELRASRARVVAAADAARRRIERDLHDGTQQQLVGLAVKLQLARHLARSEDESAESLLEEMKQDIHEALDELRELAESIYPSLLVDRGLGEALAAVAARARVLTRAEITGLDRYSPEIEAAAYFCCAELLDCIGAGAGDRVTAGIRAWSDGASLRFELQFDGDAPDDGTLDALRDRLGAVDGELHSTSGPGSVTRLLATIPLAR